MTPPNGSWTKHSTATHLKGLGADDRVLASIMRHTSRGVIVARAVDDPRILADLLRRLWRVAALLIAISGVSCERPEGESQVELELCSVVLNMHRAITLGGSAERERDVRLQLECGECETIAGEDEFGSYLYLFNRANPMTLRQRDVVSAEVFASTQDTLGFRLTLTLSQSGIDRVGDYLERYGRSQTVNEIGENVIGVMPLMLLYDSYMAGRFPTEGEAIAAAKILGVPITLPASSRS